MKIFQKPNHAVRLQVAEVFFDVKCDQNEALDEYFEYYEEELRLLRVGTSPATWQAGHLTAQNHEDIIDLVQDLRNYQSQTKKEAILKRISDRYTDADSECVTRSIDLALRLWLMVNVSSPKFQSLRPLGTCVQWTDDASLDDFVKSLFPSSRWHMSSRDSRLHVHFTAVTLVEVCGVRIHWTSSLQDHLLLDRRNRILSVFPYKSVLEAMLLAETPIPSSVLRETVQSLELLFPPWDRRTERFLLRQGRKMHDHSIYPTTRKLDLLDFDHWRDRLIEIHEEVYQAPPANWSQLWRDRRNPQLFYTFWIALAILLLTIGQFVTGIVQAWASVQALKRRV